MSGTAIINYLLSNNANLVAVVPEDRIISGVIPLGTELPAISVTQISGKQYNTLAMNSETYLVTDRVQVTAHCKDYASMKSVLALALSACPLSRGTINGFQSEGVLPESEGPDLYDPDDGIYQQSHDFMVSFHR